MTISANPVNAWDRLLLVTNETTFNTAVLPTDASNYASWAREAITVDLGPPEVGAVRPMKDRGAGRDMQVGFVEGRVEPIPWSVETSVKSRSAIDAATLEGELYAMAGLYRIAHASTNYLIQPITTPIESGVFASGQMLRFLGSGLAAYEAEQLNGCVCRKLTWEGGDKELTLKAEGVAASKVTFGALNSITVPDATDPTVLTHTAEESYRLGVGYYLCELEIMHIDAATDITRGGTSSTIQRAKLGSYHYAHNSAPLNPYVPAPSYSGSPIPETTCTVTIGGVTSRVMSFVIDFTTGGDLLPGETGSKYRQGAKFTRFDLGVKFKLVLAAAQVSLLGKVTSRATAGAVAVTIVQGSAVGGVVTFSLPYCEVESFKVGDTVNDVAIVDVSMRVYSGAPPSASLEPAFTITYT